MSTEQVLAAVRDNDVKFVRLWFSDVLGRLKSVAILSEHLPAALEQGVRFDGSSITGFNPVEETDMVAVPDLSTFAILPWRPAKNRVARLICDIHTTGGTPYEGDPRYVLRRAEERMHAMGFDELHVSPEIEFFYFRDEVDTEPLDRGGYFDLTTLDAAGDVRRDTVLALGELGIDVAFSHHESGPSQHEIDIKGRGALQIADDVMTYRTVVKEVAHAHGWYATFMPKPLADENGSGMHLHFHLRRDGMNAFFDPDDEHRMSATGRAFVAGVLASARESCVVYAQWVNSYKRLVPGYEAPVYVGWSPRNRSSIIRVPVHTDHGNETPTPELRSADPACNPYLALAALLHAGLDGVEKNLELPPPMDMNLYHLSYEDRLRAGVEMLPTTLGEAVDAAAASELLLTSFGEHIHSRLLEVKREEWASFSAHVSEWERSRYLPLL